MSTSNHFKVLYAEDNAVDADLTKSHFATSAPDFHIEIVDSGRACLERLRLDKYDALLLDNKLRDVGATDVLKELCASAISLPVVVVTGAGDEDLVVKVLRLGATDYVPKHGNYVESLPLALRNAIHDYRRGEAASRTVTPRRILYVEHYPADIDLTVRHFADVAPHFQIEVARSGLQGMMMMEAGTFDLVLTDFRMPDWNALDLLRELRTRELDIPVIVITGKGDEAAASGALKLGAYDYLVKREDYLHHLPYAIDHAISRWQLTKANDRLRSELAERQRAEAENARLLCEIQQAHEQLHDRALQLEGLVRERTIKLTEALNELESWSYSIAHDMRAPLRAMHGFSSLLAEEYASRLDETAKSYLQRITASANRLDRLIQDILNYSRMARGELQLQPVNLESLLGEILETYPSLQPPKATIEVRKPLPSMLGNTAALTQVISNLLGNAVKFVGRNVHPHVQVSAEIQGEMVELRVEDNGIGIPRESQNNIFRIFHKLHSPNDYEGTGIGLAIVRKAVERMGGEVGVESAPSKGSKFWVRLKRG
jgi:signal transduction histidine kinase